MRLPGRRVRRRGVRGRRGAGNGDESQEPQGGAEDGARGRHPTSRRPASRRATQSPLFVAIAFLVAVINLLGLVMVLSASSVLAHQQHGSSWYFVSRQALWAALGAVVLVIVARIDYHRWRRLAAPLLLVSLVALAVVLIPGVGTEVNGAQRWLGWGPVTVQPSEFVKLALIVWVADLLARRSAWIRKVRAGLRPVLLVLLLVSVLIMLQPNMGTTVVIVAVVLSVCFVAGVPMLPILRWAALGTAVVVLLAVVADYRRARLLAFVDPWSDPLDGGYQTIQSLVGLASGGVAGTGLGASRAKWGFLPFAHTDFVFSIIGEELGLVGALVVVALFALLGVLGVRTALHATDRFGMLLAIGVTAWFVVQAFVNIAVVIGLMPVTGVPLPFVSFGGSSLVVGMAGVGLLLSVARQAVTPTARPALADRESRTHRGRAAGQGAAASGEPDSDRSDRKVHDEVESQDKVTTTRQDRRRSRPPRAGRDGTGRGDRGDRSVPSADEPGGR